MPGQEGTAHGALLRLAAAHALALMPPFASACPQDFTIIELPLSKKKVGVVGLTSNGTSATSQPGAPPASPPFQQRAAAYRNGTPGLLPRTLPHAAEQPTALSVCPQRRPPPRIPALQ